MGCVGRQPREQEKLGRRVCWNPNIKTRFVPKISSSTAMPGSTENLFKDHWEAFILPPYLALNLSSLYFTRFPISITEDFI